MQFESTSTFDGLDLCVRTSRLSFDHILQNPSFQENLLSAVHVVLEIFIEPITHGSRWHSFQTVHEFTKLFPELLVSNIWAVQCFFRFVGEIVSLTSGLQSQEFLFLILPFPDRLRSLISQLPLGTIPSNVLGFRGNRSTCWARTSARLACRKRLKVTGVVLTQPFDDTAQIFG